VRGSERGIEDPERRCDPGLELLRPLGKVFSASYDPIRILSREGRGFLVLNSTKLESLAVKGDTAREQGASIVELSADGAPTRQCFATSKGGPGAATGISDGALDTQGRLAITGSFWGGGLSFGGDTFSAPTRARPDGRSVAFRSSYLAVLTDSGKHVFSSAFGGPLFTDATTVAFDAHGNVVVGGGFFESLKLGGRDFPTLESPALYLAKFDARGQLSWVHVSPFAQQPATPALTFTEGGNVVVAGGYDQQLDFGTPLPAATRLERLPCGGTHGSREGRRMFLVELDANGRLVRSDSFGEPYAEASDVATSPEGDLIVNGSFRGQLSLGGPPLRAPTSRGNCGCDFECTYPAARFVARFDRERRLVFQEAFPDALVVRATPGSGRSTIIEQGIPIYRRGPTSWGPDDYRWQLEIRSSSGSVQWSRTFEKLDLKAAVAVGSGRLAVLLHDPESSRLLLAAFRP
jgi:hypothetical protein